MFTFYALRATAITCLSATIIFCTGVIVLTKLRPPCCSQPNTDRPLCQPPLTPLSSLNPLPTVWKEKDLYEEDRQWAGRLGGGGSYTPTHCQPTARIAILVPYRNRTSHLAHFLSVMHPFLQRQNVQYTIVVVNQTGSAPFVRGLLFNAGYLESMIHLPYKPDCVILHDVDHVPERQGMVYFCSVHGITHLSHAIDRFEYSLFMAEFTGGVSAMTALQYEAVNGFSNMYLGWGCEDEDLFIRIQAQQQILVRIPADLARFTTLPHVPNYPNWFWDQFISELDRKRFPNLQEIVDRDGANTDRYDYNKYLQTAAADRIQREGLNNARDYYRLESVVAHNSFTEFQIRPDHQKIYEHGIQHLVDFEEKRQQEEEERTEEAHTREERRLEEEEANNKKQDKKVEFE